jgi:hypothetical protein
MNPFRISYLLLLLAWPALARAQEMKFIDLTSLTQRTELRYPPAPPSLDCKEGNCLGGGSGGGSVADGAPDRRDPHALGIYLLRVTPTDIDPSKPIEVDFQVRNTGTAPLDIPVSPHLSDLQPTDVSSSFDYFSIALVLAGEGDGQKTGCLGFVELYGSPEHADTMTVLKPGEWIRVRANVNLRACPPRPVTTAFRGDFWLRNNTFRPTPGGQFTEVRNLYPNATSTPAVAVRLVNPASDQPKN